MMLPMKIINCGSFKKDPHKKLSAVYCDDAFGHLSECTTQVFLSSEVIEHASVMKPVERNDKACS